MQVACKANPWLPYCASLFPPQQRCRDSRLTHRKHCAAVKAGRCRAEGQLTWQGLCQCRSAPSSPSCRQRTSRWWSASHAADVSACNWGVFLQNAQTASSCGNQLLAGYELYGGILLQVQVLRDTPGAHLRAPPLLLLAVTADGLLLAVGLACIAARRSAPSSHMTSSPRLRLDYYCQGIHAICRLQRKGDQHNTAP